MEAEKYKWSAVVSRYSNDLHWANVAEVPVGSVSTLRTFTAKAIQSCHMMSARGARIKVVLWLWPGFVS